MRMLNMILGNVVRIMLAIVFAFCLYRLFEGRMLWYLLAAASLFGLVSLRAIQPRKAHSQQ